MVWRMYQTVICLLLLSFGSTACGSVPFSAPSGVFTGASVGSPGSDHLDPSAPVPLLQLEYSAEGRIELRSNLPRQVEACRDEFAFDLCTDLDDDGLTDRWEDLALEALTPRVRFDEEEKLFYDPEAVFTAVGRVSPVPENPARIRFHLVIAHARDYGCMGFGDHDGDSERVLLDLEAVDSPSLGDAVLVQAYTAAHECTVSDHSARYTGAGLEELEFEDDPITETPRWVIYSSRNKHATYITKEICEPVFTGCFESCGPDRVRDPLLFDLRPLVANVGEPGAPLLEELSALGFPGEEAWIDQKFCGGRDRSGGCSTAIRTKLMMGPGECP